ncbi:MAG TPA: hypothetical protein VKB68_15025, partial [Stellaceae bacterium]|nr:hypothetical protein [Stellaceae bacterium]
VTTTGAQSYDEPVVLSTNDILTGSTISFGSTVDGAFGLTAAATVTTFEGTVGSGTALTSLTVTHTADLNGGSVTTTGAQTYDGPVVLSTNDLLTGSAITFGSTVDGAFGLTAAAAVTTFEGSVGSGTALTSLTVTHTADLNGGSVTTTGAQSYDGPVTLSADATLASTAGNIAFASTIDGAHLLSATASAGTVSVTGDIGGVSALTGITIDGHNGVSLTSVHTNGAQSYTSAQTITLSGLYDTGNASFTANGAVELASATTFNPGSGSLSVSGALAGSVNLTMLGSGVDTFASINLDNSGTIDLSGKTGGSFTVDGITDAAALLTGTNAYSLALLGGGTIGDPTLGNTGGDTLAGSFVFPGGLTVPSTLTLTLGGATELNEETSGITLGTVNQGGNIFIVVADSVSLNGPWNGTGPRGITPFSNLPINLNNGSSGWALTDAELQILADPPSFVVIGGGTAITAEVLDIVGGKPIFVPPSPPGPINVGTFTFDAPLILIGSSIVLDGTLSKTSGGVGFITPGSVGGPGSLDLGPGTGILAIAAASADLNGTVNGTSGKGAASDVTLIVPPGTGPYLINGACFAGCGGTINTSLLGSLILFSNLLDLSQGGLAGGLGGDLGGGTGGLGGISPSGGPGSGDNAPTDAAVDVLSGPLNAPPPSQAVPRLQGYYISLLGGMLSVWQDAPGTQGSGKNPEENTDYSGWGNEADW